MNDLHAHRAAPATPTAGVWRARLRMLGPGLITGAADDDPSGIATYSQAGAQFGFQMLWTLVLTYPLMCAVQMVGDRIGYVTGQGLATNIRRTFPAVVLYAVVGMLLVVNTISQQHRAQAIQHGRQGVEQPDRKRAQLEHERAQPVAKAFERGHHEILHRQHRMPAP